MSTPAERNKQREELKREFKYIFKIVVVGDSGVGKTSLIRTYTDGQFQHYLHPDGLLDKKEKVLRLGSDKIKLEIWDTAGQERYRSLTASYYRGAHGCLILFDASVTDATTNTNRSLDRCVHWLDDTTQYCNDSTCKMLVATKCHLLDETKTLKCELGKKFADENNLSYMELSSEKNMNVNETFEKLAQILYTEYSRRDSNLNEKVNEGQGNSLHIFKSTFFKNSLVCPGSCVIL
ncbi:unnamed protein product [Owenia fusiformis]|uniref:Uncharacterized protein n=1 Tax=Owenia fusiformis TaxID=6347 RepID=A0A8J1Y7M2_OWEFU|nr:unnamed protein product [Owenia fusiformis]